MPTSLGKNTWRGTTSGGAYEDQTHLDLYIANSDEQQAEVERLISLGAERVQDWPYPEGTDFVVLRDPEGNLFCVLDHE